MTNLNEAILAKWEEITTLVENVGQEVQKNANGNGAAGTRARKGLRNLKSLSAELVRITLNKS